MPSSAGNISSLTVQRRSAIASASGTRCQWRHSLRLALLASASADSEGGKEVRVPTTDHTEQPAAASMAAAAADFGGIARPASPDHDDAH